MSNSETFPLLQNNVNETVTLIALPLQIFQQGSQQQNVIGNRQILFKSLPDGSIIIDTNQFYNNGNAPMVVDCPEIEQDPGRSSDLIGKAIAAIEDKDEETITTENISPEINHKNKQKVRYLNNKTRQNSRNSGRNRKDENKSEITEKTGPFKCKFCDKEFRKWSLLIRHEKSHLNENKFKCPTCTASFNILSNFLLHLATHNTSDPTCPECGKKFTRNASLKAHLMYHEKEETFYCEECDMSFQNEMEMETHLKGHGKIRNVDGDSLQCRYCQLTFDVQSELKKHVSEHNKMKSLLQVPRRKTQRKVVPIERKHQCKICLKAFQKHSQIERHMRVHSGEKPYECKECDRGFSQKGSLQIHMTRHTGIKPHKCALCPAKFSQKGNLRAHISKTHSVPAGGANVFSCSECACVFTRLGSLNGHMTRNHPKQKESDIKAVMSQLAAMQNHMTIADDILQQAMARSDLPQLHNVNEKPDTPIATYVTLADLGIDGTMRRYIIKLRIAGDIRWHMCSFCPKEFKKPSDLVRHIRVHTREKPYKCKVCSRSFAVKSTLTSHVKIHRKVKKIQCKHCPKYFSSWSSLNVHARKHTGSKPYKCSVCTKTFRTTLLLQQHFQIHLTSAKDTLYSKDPNSEIIMQQPIYISSKGLQSVGVPLRKRPLVEAGAKNRPYTCLICNAGFRKLSHLKQHHIRHTGERPFRCHLCLRSFSSTGVLKSHILTHSGAKPYTCVLCNKNFATNGSLRRHFESHSTVRPFLCPYCFKDFKTVLSCRKHMKIHKLELTLQLQASKDCGFTSPDLVQPKPSELPFPPDLTDPLNEPFILVNHDLINHEEIVDDPEQSEMVTQTLRADKTGTVVLPVIANQENLTQENMQEIEDTLNSQMLNINGDENYINSSPYLKNKTDEPIATTDELVSTLTENSVKSIDDNAYLYQHVIVNLNSEAEQMFDNVGIDNILSQVKLQNDSLFLTDLNSININESNNILSYQIAEQTDLQQNQMLLQIEPEPTQIDQSINIDESIHLEQSINLEPNLQIKLQAMGDFLSSQQEQNLLVESAQFLNETQDLIQTKTLEKEQIHTEEEEQITNDAMICNLCKLNFKNKTDLKLHRCLHFVDVNVNPRNENELADAFTLPATEVVFDFGNSVDGDAIEESVDVTPNNVPVYRNQCTFCPKTFRKPSDLQRHLRTHTGERPFKCNECAKSFSLKSTLESHVRVHQDRKSFACNVCGSLFASKGSLNVHMRLHTGAKPYKCCLCHLRFRTSGHRKAHLAVHYKEAAKTGKLPHQISTRKAKMSVLMDGVQSLIGDLNPKELDDKDPDGQLEELPLTENSVKSYENIVLGTQDSQLMQFEVQTNEHGHILNIKPASNLLIVDDSSKNQLMPQVEFDDKTKKDIEFFISEKCLKQKNESQKKKICDVCQKEFASNYQLVRHQKIHNNEREHACTHCTRTFTQKSSLISHLNVHSGKRPFACPYCSNTFSQSGNLKTHIKRIHGLVTDATVNEEISADLLNNS